MDGQSKEMALVMVYTSELLPTNVYYISKKLPSTSRIAHSLKFQMARIVIVLNILNIYIYKQWNNLTFVVTCNNLKQSRIRRLFYIDVNDKE